MSAAATPAKRHDRLRRLRNLLSHSSPTIANQTDSCFTASHSASISKPIHSKPTSSTLSVARLSSPCASLSSGPGGRPASLAGQQCLAAASALSRDFLDRALQLLSQRERETIEEHILPTTDEIDSALRDAFNAAQDKQQLCEGKRWTFTFGEHTVRLRDEADTVMLWLDRFKQVGDIAVNADPIQAGLPWAGVRLLLEVQKDIDHLFVTL